MLALLAQLAAEPRDPAANAERAAAALAAHPEADIAVFPELFLSGYTLRGLEAAARTPDAGELRRVAEAAALASTAVAIGFAEARVDGIANALALIDQDGSLAGVYRKTQLFGAEREAFVAGGELLVAPLAGRRVGALICFDVEFPELARRLALAGAELFVTASANMEPFYADHELATRARALENRLPHVYANLVGACDGVCFVGGSRSVDAGGRVVAEAAHSAERLVLAPVGERGVLDDRVDYLRHLPQTLPVAAR